MFSKLAARDCAQEINKLDNRMRHIDKNDIHFK